MHRRLAAALLLSGADALAPRRARRAALAHAELIASTPAEHASLAAAPERVELTFDEPVTLAAEPARGGRPGQRHLADRPAGGSPAP